MGFMVAKVEKREREEGKATEFMRDGAPIPEKTIERLKRRKIGNQTTHSHFSDIGMYFFPINVSEHRIAEILMNIRHFCQYHLPYPSIWSLCGKRIGAFQRAFISTSPNEYSWIRISWPSFSQSESLKRTCSRIKYNVERRAGYGCWYTEQGFVNRWRSRCWGFGSQWSYNTTI